jgi:LmbE family N-acetylglucosaminyl deacetylase
MIRESDLIPFTVSPPKGDKALILAPHPDDETLGCGGTIRLLLLRKTPVKVIFLTSGEKAESFVDGTKRFFE